MSSILSVSACIGAPVLSEFRRAVQMEAQAGMKRLLVRLRRQLFVLDEAPRISECVVQAMTAAVLSLASQVKNSC